MTDQMSSTTIATQTPLPRTHLSFASLAASNATANQKSSPFENQMLENELLLQTQRNAIKVIDSKLNEPRQHNENIAYANNNPIDGQQHDSTFHENHSPSVPSIATQRMKIDQIAMKMVRKIS